MTLFGKSNAGPHNRGLFSKTNGAMSGIFQKTATAMRSIPGHLDTMNYIAKKGIEYYNTARAAAPIAAEVGAMLL